MMKRLVKNKENNYEKINKKRDKKSKKTWMK